MTLSQANPSSLRPPDDDGRSVIVAIGPDRREEAIARLLANDGTADADHARRFLDYARLHAVTLEHLWGRIDQRGRFLAVVLAVPNPGRSAMIFASQSRSVADIERTAGVLDVACKRLQHMGLHLAQTLLEPHDTAAHDTFVAGQFHRLATLGYLERSLRSRLLPPKPQWPSGVTLHEYNDSLRAELIGTLDATYEQTLDCPGLRGYRQTADILEGHRAAGIFDHRLWTILRLDGRAAGTLLLNPSADRVSIELVYLGIVRWARGRRLGKQLLRHGLHLVAARQERVMTLAVDEANTPALALYEREQFRAVLRRVAMIRGLTASGGSATA